MSEVGTVILGRDANGLYAMQSTCTHAATPLVVRAAAGGITPLFCPGHGSGFDANGFPRVGPATVPLQHHRVAVTVEGDRIVLKGRGIARRWLRDPALAMLRDVAGWARAGWFR